MIPDLCSTCCSSSQHLSATQVRRFDAHKGPVNDLCFDETAEFIGSCSDDGGAMVCYVITRFLQAQRGAQVFCRCRCIAYTQTKCSSSSTTAPSRYAAKHAQLVLTRQYCCWPCWLFVKVVPACTAWCTCAVSCRAWPLTPGMAAARHESS